MSADFYNNARAKVVGKMIRQRKPDTITHEKCIKLLGSDERMLFKFMSLYPAELGYLMRILTRSHSPKSVLGQCPFPTVRELYHVIKEKLDGIKGDAAYFELLDGLLKIVSPEVISELDLLKQQNESYGDVILRILRAGRRDANELEGFIRLIKQDKKEGRIRIEGNRVRIEPVE